MSVRTERLNLRVSVQELDTLRKLAVQKGLSVSAYIREKALSGGDLASRESSSNQRVPVPAKREQLAEQADTPPESAPKRMTALQYAMANGITLAHARQMIGDA